jgi:hypothetical protein
MRAPLSASASALASARRLLAVLAVLLTAALVLIAPPAHAHGGPIDSEVSQDGLGGVYVSFFHTEDGHPVEGLLDATVEGRSADGTVIGPLPLTSASQGVGIWETAAEAFPEGAWQLTVRVADPQFEETVDIEIAMADVVEDAEHGDSAGSGDAAAAASGQSGESSGEAIPWWPLAVGLGVIALAAGVAALIVRRRREPARR